jgi:hypothetical protein
MIFAILVIILVGVIAFFHYTQGFWSATLSAIIAVIAAVLAIGYHENVVDSLLKGKMADYAHAISLVAVFGLSYLILRIIVDKAIPGNLRLPVILDKVGAGVMGFVAAIFSVGVVAVAAQALPFGPSVAGYTRFEMTEDRDVSVVVPNRQSQEYPIADQLDQDTFTDETHKGLLLPVDDWVVGLVSHLSDGGSLAGTRPLTDVHPAYLDELFAQRLGIQAGAMHVASNAAKKQVDVRGVFRAPAPLPQADGETSNTRPNNKVVKWPEPKKDETLLVLRIGFNDGTADSGKAPEYVRFSTGSIRLLARSEEEGSKNYYPVGTVDGGAMLLANRMDDFLFTSEGAAADVAFIVKTDDVIEGKPDEGKAKIKDGVFVEVKRLAREDLSGKPVEDGIKPDKSVNVLRKQGVVDAAKKALTAPPPPNEAKAAEKPAEEPPAAP